MTRVSSVVLRESHARGQLLASAIFHRARQVVIGSVEPYAALRDDPGLRSILEASIFGESVTGASILDTRGVVVASSDPTLGRQRPRAARRPGAAGGGQRAVAARRDLLARRPHARSAAADDARRRGLRLDPRRRVHGADAPGAERVAGPGAADGGRRADRRGGRGGHPGAAAAAADSRHPQRLDAAGAGRVRRDARPAARRRVRRAGHLLQPRQPAAVRRSHAAPGQERQPAVGRRAPGGRRGDVQPVGRAALRQPGDGGAAAGQRRGPDAVVGGADRPFVPHARRRDHRHARVARAGAGQPGRRDRAAADDAGGDRHRRRPGGRAARGAQRHHDVARAVDDRLLAQAGRAGPADGRHRPRGQEPAERDDDPPGAAAHQAAQRRRLGGRAAAAGRRGGRAGPLDRGAGDARRRPRARSSTWRSSRARCAGSTAWCRAS